MMKLNCLYSNLMYVLSTMASDWVEKTNTPLSSHHELLSDQPSCGRRRSPLNFKYDCAEAHREAVGSKQEGMTQLGPHQLQVKLEGLKYCSSPSSEIQVGLASSNMRKRTAKPICAALLAESDQLSLNYSN